MNIGDKKKMLGWLAGAGLSIAGALGGAYLVAPNEGKVNTVYPDPIGIATSCYGHTGSELKAGARYSDLDCLNQLATDLGKSEQSVSKVIKVPMTFYQEAALISFTYNVGEDNLRKSTLAKEFNAKHYKQGCEELLKWVYAGGKKLDGLVNRRQDEYQMCIGDLE